MPPLVSIVVPVLEDSRAVACLFEGLPPDRRLEVVIVDGGHDRALDRIAAARTDVRLIRTRPGRGHQMNMGARAADGVWILFLHADSRLPSGWLDVLVAGTTAAVGGWFRFALDHGAWQARVIERVVEWRVRLFRLPYGDQGLFVRRATFAELGGYRELPLMEDVEFVRRLRCAGRLVELPVALATSARRWERDGWFRRSARNVLLVTLYFARVSPTRLERWYR